METMDRGQLIANKTNVRNASHAEHTTNLIGQLMPTKTNVRTDQEVMPEASKSHDDAYVLLRVLYVIYSLVVG